MKKKTVCIALCALLALLTAGQVLLGGVAGFLSVGILSAHAAGSPYIETDKDTYYVGEDIYVTAWGDAETDLVFYPIDYVPGRDASLYWATFEGTAVPEGLIPSDTPVKLTDIPGNNKGNPQAEPYYGELPAGEYKFVLRKNGAVLVQHNITVELAPATVEPYLVTDKTTYTVGEDIYVTAAGDEDVSINFYPIDYVPGTHPTIYYANFSDYGLEESVPMNTPVKLTDLPGNNRGNGMVNDYYNGLPAGEYKFVLRQSGTPILQVNITIVEPPVAGLPEEPHITLEKTEFYVGEPIYFTAWGTADMSVNFYPLDFVPGQDATIYYANFQGYGLDEAIPLNTSVKVTDMPGNNKGNWQVKDYYDELPAGDYKLVMRENGTPILQVELKIVEAPVVEPTLSVDKSVYTVGEDIYITAAGNANVSVNVYPLHFVPGQDATIYYANFEGYGLSEAIPMNTPVKLTELPGNNKGNAQANPYYGILPAGEYKVVLREDGTPIMQVEFSVVEPETEEPETDAPETDAPETDAPETDAPETDAPETDAPETDAPETDAPETDAPETDAPETDEPETDAPETDEPETDAPETDAPETDAPETNAPETDAPETDAPETDAPDTGNGDIFDDDNDGDNGCFVAIGSGSLTCLILLVAGAAYVTRKKD